MSNVVQIARGERLAAAQERARREAAESVAPIDVVEAERVALAAGFQSVHRMRGNSGVDVMAVSFGRNVAGALVRAFGKETAKRFARSVIEAIRAEVGV